MLQFIMSKRTQISYKMVLSLLCPSNVLVLSPPEKSPFDQLTKLSQYEKIEDSLMLVFSFLNQLF